jgi:hypothetical protein
MKIILLLAVPLKGPTYLMLNVKFYTLKRATVSDYIHKQAKQASN